MLIQNPLDIGTTTSVSIVCSSMTTRESEVHVVELAVDREPMEHTLPPRPSNINDPTGSSEEKEKFEQDSEKEKFWEIAKAAGLDREDFEVEAVIKKWKIVMDVLIPVVLVILVIIADSKMADKLPYPGDCSKTKSLDYACIQPFNFDPSFSWKSTSGIEMFSNTTGTNMDYVSFPINKTTRICQLSVLSATTTTSSSWEYRTIDSNWKAVLSFIPFVLVFQGILSLKMSSRIVAPGVLFITILLGLNYFRDSSYFANDTLPEAFGKVGLVIVDRFFWTIFEYALNVFAAFFFLRVLELWGIVDAMRVEFERIAPNSNRKLLLVGYCFAIGLAVVAPGGSNFVIAGTILIHMNLTNSPEESPERREGT